MSKRTFLAVTAAAVTAIGLSSMPAQASTSSASAVSASTAHSTVHLLRPPYAKHSASISADTRQGSPPLVDHGGPVLGTEQSYAIYWNPGHLQSGTAAGIGGAYKALVQRWFADAAATGVYKNNVQYSSLGHTPTSTSFAGAWEDTTPFPVGHCSNPYTGGNCVTDADITALVSRLARTHGITSSMSKMFFVYTPKGEGSCYDSGCSDASYANYCAYHGAIYSGTSKLPYANMPWQVTPSGSASCYYTPGGQTAPSGNIAADAVVNVTSHEQNEAVTDPLINAWYDSSGEENGDECAWQFGPSTTGGGDVYVNGHAYSVQEEASNRASNCVIFGPSGP